MSEERILVCFVCLGNICRSPTAEGVMRHLVREAGLEARIGIESAGTAAHHVGEPPDPRAREAAGRRAIELSGRARRFRTEDFDRFDYVLAMDRENLSDLRALRPDGSREAPLSLLRSFDPAASPEAEVPDPYYGGEQGFDEVLDLCEAACRGLLARIVERAGWT